jgi:putative membrane protein
MNMARTNRNAWMIGLGVVLLLGLVALSAMGRGMMGPGFAGYGARPFVGPGPWMWGFGLIGLVIRVAIWGAIIMFVMSLFRRRSSMHWDRDTQVSHSQPSSLEILRRRYAAGEISREQFEEMRQVLEPSPGSV